MSSTDTMKDGKDNNIDAAITEEIKSVAMSDDSKKDTDKKCTSYEQNTMNNITEDLNSMAIRNDTSVCGNCGKEGSDVNNICNKCKQVMYCNAACKKKHRHKHKKACERRVAEMHDEKLFQEPPQLHEDCPICFLRMPSRGKGTVYMACCGKVICHGCTHTVQSRAVIARRQDQDDVCPFCRTTPPGSFDEVIKRYEKRMKLNDAIGTFNLGSFYDQGLYGLRENHAKALELYYRAGELGSAQAYFCIGNAYSRGRGVEQDTKKARHYFEIAAMKGGENARCNLGAIELVAGNIDRALKHWMIAVKDGNAKSLENIKQCYIDGHASKEDYTKALRLRQAYLDEIKSDQRDEAFADDEIQILLRRRKKNIVCIKMIQYPGVESRLSQEPIWHVSVEKRCSSSNLVYITLSIYTLTTHRNKRIQFRVV